MPSPFNWEATGGFAVLGWRRAASDRGSALARGLLYLLVLGIFWAFWRATALDELLRRGLTPERLIWYLAITEWIVFATGMPYREIEEDIRTGALATGLSRPLGYAQACLAQWLGAAAFHLPVFAAIGFGATLWLTASVPLTWAVLPVWLLSALLAIAILFLCQLMIGFASIWTGSSAPVYWIWQKGLFVLGGLILPLSLYPTALRSFAQWSPFAAMLSAPASMALDSSARHITTVLELQVGWLIALGVLAWQIDRAAIGRLVMRGI